MSKKPTRTGEFSDEAFTPGWVEFHCEHELVMEWYVKNQKEAGVQYPFVFDPYPESGPPYFCIRLILGNEYFYWTGETVMPFKEPDTACVCGEPLAYWTGWAHGVPSQRIRNVCPKCGQIFSLNGKSCDILDGWTRDRSPLLGGLTFRFALAVDCHKYSPREEQSFRAFHLRPNFLELWRTTLALRTKWSAPRISGGPNSIPIREKPIRSDRSGAVMGELASRVRGNIDLMGSELVVLHNPASLGITSTQTGPGGGPGASISLFDSAYQFFGGSEWRRQWKPGWSKPPS